jgi:hypothetical protein
MGSSSCVVLSRFFLVAQCACPQSCKRLPHFPPKYVTTLYHPLYSPALSPPDYLVFPKLKMKLKGLHFVDVAEIQGAVTVELKEVHKEEFSAAVQKLQLCKSLYICQWSLF